MSGQIRQGVTQYIGIMNGTVYRIDGNTDKTGELFKLVTLEIQSAALDGHLAPRSAPSSSIEAKSPVSVAGADAAIETAAVQKDESDVRLFTRDGPESLRAGHPDLWHLLVAGTCLEGSTFRSA